MITVITMNPSVDRSYEVDNFQLEKVQRANSMIATAGGKGLNVARVIKSLGGHARCMGFLGGHTGDFIRQEVLAHGLAAHFTTIAGTSRTCLNICNQDGCSTEIIEPGPVIEPREVEVFKGGLEAVLADTKILVAAGSLPPGVPNECYAEIAAICKRRSIKFILDSSGEALRAALVQQPFLIKPNETELAALSGMRVETEAEAFAASSRVLEMGAENVCVSLGKKGMMLNGSMGRLVVHIPTVKVQNTVGCGDSLVGGLAYALEQGWNVFKMLKFANACGISNALHAGVGIIDPSQVEFFSGQVTVLPYADIN